MASRNIRRQKKKKQDIPEEKKGEDRAVSNRYLNCFLPEAKSGSYYLSLIIPEFARYSPVYR